MKKEEETYKDFLSDDYELLYRLVEQGEHIICFMDVNENFGTYRKQHTTISTKEFSSLYLAFMEKEDNKKEAYITFCKGHNLTFINPNLELK